MNPQQKGVLYERKESKRRKSNPRDGHIYIPGNEIREYHLMQLYSSEIISTRPVARRQLAILHQGKSLKGKNGSVLIGIDGIECSLPEKIKVTHQFDFKYTEKPVLPFANITSTELIARINKIPTTVVCNVSDIDTQCKMAAVHNPKLKFETVPFDMSEDDGNVDIEHESESFVFTPRDYQVNVFQQINEYVSNIDTCKQNKIFCNLPSAFGKSHLVFIATDLILQKCDVCYVLVSSIECAEQIIEKFYKYHASSSCFKVKNMTSLSDKKLKEQLRDPSTMQQFKSNKTVCFMYHRTFEDISDDLDLTSTCGIFDEVHKYPNLVKKLKLRLCIGLSAKKDTALMKIFNDNVIELDEEDIERMRKTAFVPKIIIRIDTRCDDDDYNEISDSLNLQETSRRIMNAYNYSTARQCVVVIPSDDCKLDDFDRMRHELYDRTKETNEEIFITAFKRLHGPKSDIHVQFFCEPLKKKLRHVPLEIDRIELNAIELETFPMQDATQNSVIEVDNNFWVSCGFEIVRQDSKSNENGFDMLKQMLKRDHSGIIQTKHQFFEGQDFPMLKHTILAGRIHDPHTLNQLIWRNGRICENKNYAMLSSVYGTSIETFALAIAIYDPGQKIMQLEYFHNIPLTTILAQSDAEWSSSVRMNVNKVSNSIQQAIAYNKKIDKREESLIKETIIHLHDNYKLHAPPQKYIQISNKRIDWKLMVENLVINLNINTNHRVKRIFSQITWLDFNRKGSMFDMNALTSADEPLKYTSQNSSWPVKNFKAMETLVEEINRNVTIQRGMYSAVNDGNVICIPVHLMCLLNTICTSTDEFVCPQWDFCDSVICAPVRKIQFELYSKVKVEFPKKPVGYEMCLELFKNVLEHESLKSCLYDLNCSFQSSYNNVEKTILHLHKWNSGYSATMPFTINGRKMDSTSKETVEHIAVKVNNFNMASDVYKVYDEAQKRNGKLQNHNTLEHKLSKLFYVQLMIFFILYHWSKRIKDISVDDKMKILKMFTLLNKLKIHSSHVFERIEPPSKKVCN